MVFNFNKIGRSTIDMFCVPICAQNICVLLPQFVVAAPICNKSAAVCNRCPHL